MSNLIAIAYEDRSTAEQVRSELIELMREHAIELEDMVVITNENGKAKLHQTMKPAGVAAASGALWGGLIGLIFLAPVLGMAVGAATGGAAGALTDVGVDDTFLRELGTSLPAGGAALVVLVRVSTPDKVLPRVSGYGGHIIQSSLSDEAEARLNEALAMAAH